jgi:plastocyanin
MKTITKKIVFVLTLIASSGAIAGSFVGTATNKEDGTLANVVFALKPLSPGILVPSLAPTLISVTQDDLQFKPYVSVIRRGSSAQFPNRDKVEHHIKSFSSIKPFEIAVHKPGDSPSPIVFDKEGAVIVYCILHDWMRAFIYVADTPWFSTTENLGAARIENLPAGEYEISAWHPDLGQFKPPFVQKITIPATGSATTNFKFEFMPKTLRRPKPVRTSAQEADWAHDHAAMTARN